MERMQEDGPLTVGELREALKRFPDDAVIVEHDEEGNYREVYADPGMLALTAIVDGRPNKEFACQHVSIANLAT